MAWISMPRRLTSMWPDVEFFKLNREPADVDRVSVAREVAEDRGPFCGCGDGRRAARGGSGAGTRAGAFGGTWSARSVNCDAVLDAGSMVAPFVSRLVPAVWHEALSLLSGSGATRSWFAHPNGSSIKFCGRSSPSL